MCQYFQKHPVLLENGTLFQCQLTKKTSIPVLKRKIAELLGCPPLYFSFGTKYDNRLHTQIRTGTIPLNAYLFQNQKTTSPACPCGYSNENVTHFLLHCSLYNTIRETCFGQISELLHIDFSNLSSAIQLDLLINGTSLDPEDGRRVAGSFQRYITSSLVLRCAAGGGGGGGTVAPLNSTAWLPADDKTEAAQQAIFTSFGCIRVYVYVEFHHCLFVFVFACNVFLVRLFTIDLCLTVIYLLLLFSIRGEAPCHKSQSFCADPHFVILSSSCDWK